MVLAYHLILSCYGFWLPNDPRGSWSDEVRRYELLKFGPATKMNTRRSVAGIEHDYALRAAAKAALKFAPVVFSGLQAQAVAAGFAEICRLKGFIVYACTIMPGHVHLVIGRANMLIEDVARRLKAKATMQLNKGGLGFDHSPWAEGEWKVYLNSAYETRRAIRYVERNPVRAGLRRQRWAFAVPYLGQ